MSCPRSKKLYAEVCRALSSGNIVLYRRQEIDWLQPYEPSQDFSIFLRDWEKTSHRGFPESLCSKGKRRLHILNSSQLKFQTSIPWFSTMILLQVLGEELANSWKDTAWEASEEDRLRSGWSIWTSLWTSMRMLSSSKFLCKNPCFEVIPWPQGSERKFDAEDVALLSYSSVPLYNENDGRSSNGLLDELPLCLQ